MTFEEKLSEIYNKIANEIKWDDTSRMGPSIYDSLCK